MKMKERKKVIEKENGKGIKNVPVSENDKEKD